METSMKSNQPTTERLAAALRSAGAPSCMIEKAEAGEYDDYKAKNTATPCVDLVRDLALAASAAFDARLIVLHERALNGEFDAQKWESDAWAKSMKDDPEMGPILKAMNLQAGR